MITVRRTLLVILLLFLIIIFVLMLTDDPQPTKRLTYAWDYPDAYVVITIPRAHGELPDYSSYISDLKQQRAKFRSSRNKSFRSCDARCLSEIQKCENRSGDPTLDHPDPPGQKSSASGLYGVLDSTWDGYGGYARAKDAPADTQHAWAKEAAVKAGTKPWKASQHCWGPNL